MYTKEDWQGAQAKLRDLGLEEQRILELLAQGLSHRRIGEELGLHRSAIWRRVKKLRARLEEQPGAKS